VRLDFRAVGAAACLILCVSCSGGSGPSHATIAIGVDLPLTGAEAPAAKPALNGVRFFFSQHPRIDGLEVVLAPRDDARGETPSPELGLADVQGFISNPSLVAMIGPFDAAVARKEIPAANQADLAMVSPATSSPCLTKDVYLPAALNPDGIAVTCKDAGLPSASDLRPHQINNFFRLTTTDELQGPAAADYAGKTLHLVRVAVITDHEAYGQALAAGFTTRFQKLGGTVVGNLDMSATGGTDPMPFLTSMKAAGAQAIYFGGTAADKGCSVRAAMKGIFAPGEATPFLGGDGIAEDPACITSAGDNSPGIFATVPAPDAATTANAAPTIAAFQAAFPRAGDYGPYTILAYDAAAVLYAALDRAVRADYGRIPPRGNVVSQLTATAAFSGATGTFAFDTAGDTTHRVLSVFEATSADPKLPWKFAQAVDYSTTPPY